VDSTFQKQGVFLLEWLPPKLARKTSKKTFDLENVRLDKKSRVIVILFAFWVRECPRLNSKNATKTSEQKIQRRGKSRVARRYIFIPKNPNVSNILEGLGTGNGLRSAT
jgi:hypothetical protein